jgi:hypothetical protein
VITDDQVAALFARANPVHSLDLLDPVEPVDIDSLRDRSERSREMTEVKTPESGGEVRRRGQRPGLLVAAAVAVVLAIGLGVFLASRGPQIPATPVAHATAFWTAMSSGDRDTVLALMAPGVTEPGGANTFGRAHTLWGQFDWYEAVGFRWALDQCLETAEGDIECMVSGRNAWSDALRIEPVHGTFIMEVGEDGITAIDDKQDSFASRWSPLVFERFFTWVEVNYPADAAVMWADVDVTPEILELFEINTQRFVEAQTGG